MSEQVAALVSALERTEANFIAAVNGRPVRDMAENLAENRAALLLAATAPTPDEVGRCQEVDVPIAGRCVMENGRHTHTPAGRSPDEVGLVEYRVVGMDQDHGFNRSTDSFREVDGFNALDAARSIQRARGGTIETRRVTETPWTEAKP